MRRIRCASDGSVFRLATQLAQPATVSVLSAAMVLGTPGLAAAQPARDPDGIAALIADVADANQQLQNLGAQIAEEKEGVNKALVELQTARDDAAAEDGERIAAVDVKADPLEGLDPGAVHGVSLAEVPDLDPPARRPADHDRHAERDAVRDGRADGGSRSVEPAAAREHGALGPERPANVPHF